MRPDPESLYLHEEILLLTLRDKEGTFHSKGCLPPLAGALLAELLLAGRIVLEEGRKKLVTPAGGQPIDEPVLDETLERIRTAGRRASLKDWVQRLIRIPKLHDTIAAGLCRRGVLREDEEQVLLFFRRKIYPEVDPRPERRLIDRLRRAIFSDDRHLDPRTVVLVSLAASADLLSIPFEKSDLKQRRTRIKSIIDGQLLAPATKEAIEAAQAAIAVALIMPAAITAARRAGR